MSKNTISYEQLLRVVAILRGLSMTELSNICDCPYGKFSHIMNYRQPFPPELKDKLNRRLGLEKVVHKMGIE